MIVQNNEDGFSSLSSFFMEHQMKKAARTQWVISKC
jgi:hypothetical protein